MRSGRARLLPHLRVLTALAACVLAGCGGGDGDKNWTSRSGGSSAPPGGDAGASYPAGSGELAAWNELQAARTQCGFGAVTQNAKLDSAARAHANYLIAETTGTDLAVSHIESNTNSTYFTGASPSDRASAAGYGTNVIEILAAAVEIYGGTTAPAQPSDAARGERAMRGLLNSVAHLGGAMSGAREAGIGAQTSSTQSPPSSTTTLTVNYRLGALLGLQNGTQLLGAGQVATYPCAGSVDVDYAFAPATESPNPFPEITNPAAEVGPPIYIRADAGALLTITAASLRDAGGALQPVRTDVGAVGGHEFFMVPVNPLLPGAAYTATFTGSANGAAFTRSFSFRTRSP